MAYVQNTSYRTPSHSIPHLRLLTPSILPCPLSSSSSLVRNNKFMNRWCHDYVTATPTSRVTPTSLSISSINFSHPHQSTTTTRTRTRTRTTLYAQPATIASKFLIESTTTTNGIIGSNHHFLVRILFLRCFAFVYSIAFLIAYRQNKALIGDDGITPARDILDVAERRGVARQVTRRRTHDLEKDRGTSSQDGLMMNEGEEGGDGGLNIANETPILQKQNDRTTIQQYISRLNRTILHQTNTTTQKIREILWDRTDASNRPLPTILWALSPSTRQTNLNPTLDRIALVGLIISLGILTIGAANVPLLLGLYVCQRSLMAVGGPWYSYGWEPQLAELTFLTVFTVPLFSLDPIPYNTPVPLVAVWANRWLLFRIMMGAGLIKLRSGDVKWKLSSLFSNNSKSSTSSTSSSSSAMDCFYETQPVPNPFSRAFHRMPKGWHKFEVLMNHMVELVVPWFLMMPVIGGFGRRWRIGAGMIQIVFQGAIIASGNLSFLNWLTMLPALYCFDDAFLSNLFSPGYRMSAAVAGYTNTFKNRSIPRTITNILFLATIAKLSIPVVKNLLSKRQIMNGSFDRLQLVNTYGAFGRVAEEREELIVSSARDVTGPWREYQFRVKPGDVARRPRWVSPYHHRLDWQMWIAACLGSIERSPWMYRFLWKLLREDEGILGLMECNPWDDDDGRKGGIPDVGRDDNVDGGKLKYIRVERYKYKFSEGNGKDYWVREKIGNFFPRQGVCTEGILEDMIARHSRS